MPDYEDEIIGLEDDENECEDFRQRKEPETHKVEVTLSREVYETIRVTVVGMSIEQWCASALAKEAEKYRYDEEEME